jgi:2-polyprenyl-6-methoxyphenol hydroxylase-like FAD-dependent oxidoreductase
MIGVLGGGPAGAFAAERLAAAGVGAVLFDDKLAWEKPCGGGLTYKAYQRYPFLLDNDRPKRLVTTTQLATPGAGAVSMNLGQPLVIYSRVELNRLLLDRAERAGAQIEQACVLGMERAAGRWRLQTARGACDADFCIVATGARNPLRAVGTHLTPADTMLAMGYFVPREQDCVDIQFFPKFEGYLWVFPRCGHLSVGICGKGEPAAALRAQGLALTVVDEPQLGSGSVPTVLSVTDPRLVIVRFHGRNSDKWYAKVKTTAERFDYLYNEDELRAWVPGVRQLAEQAAEVHLLFNNNAQDYAIQNARQLALLLGQEVGLDVVPAEE